MATATYALPPLFTLPNPPKSSSHRRSLKSPKTPHPAWNRRDLSRSRVTMTAAENPASANRNTLKSHRPASLQSRYPPIKPCTAGMKLALTEPVKSKPACDANAEADHERAELDITKPPPSPPPANPATNPHAVHTSTTNPAPPAPDSHVLRPVLPSAQSAPCRPAARKDGALDMLGVVVAIRNPDVREGGWGEGVGKEGASGGGKGRMEKGTQEGLVVRREQVEEVVVPAVKVAKADAPTATTTASASVSAAPSESASGSAANTTATGAAVKVTLAVKVPAGGGAKADTAPAVVKKTMTATAANPSAKFNPEHECERRRRSEVEREEPGPTNSELAPRTTSAIFNTGGWDLEWDRSTAPNPYHPRSPPLTTSSRSRPSHGPSSARARQPDV
ncbi:hypothetical protein DFP72DRAFT_1079569 [Ephemerocybe angulata]|uniref:Uncharacterized protein n=1 Tax=Ephemerocybe angulata TaxID=980116 RepID=A0A8H6LTZ5_9AGAR|nr:hypothetical protein DFP72DRAFT_1079569 [Tulosesus angulatus]